MVAGSRFIPAEQSLEMARLTVSAQQALVQHTAGTADLAMCIIFV